jgi:ubiquinone/menaquinone biosynthesis C-methylase UbiE
MSTGKVYAVDVQKDLLTKVKNTAAKEGIHNIEIIWSDIEKPNGTKLRDSSADLVLLCNTLFQLEDKHNIINEIRRILKPGGRVLVVDWLGSFGGIGPKPDQVVPANIVKEKFSEARFHLDREFSAGAHHYGLIFKKL